MEIEEPAEGQSDAAAGDSGPSDAPQSASRRIRLRRGGAIVLGREGFRIIASRGMSRSPFHPYEQITHLAPADRALLVATETGTTIIRARDFASPEQGPREAAEALLGAIAARPTGREQIARMATLDAMASQPARTWTIWSVIALCVLVTFGQWRDPMLQEFGAFNPLLFESGEYWRAVTSHFLHGAPRFPVHLAMNVAGLLVLGHLVERPLGPWRTLLIIALGGLGSILGSVYYGYPEVIGASGLVSALAGAILALELRCPERLPAYWRLPRRLFLWALFLQFVIIDPLLSSYLAGGAHLGGFLAGFAATWLLGAPMPTRIPTPVPSLRALAVATAVLVLISFGPPIALMRHDEGALERHALRLLNTPAAVHPEGILHENAIAWFIVTEGEPSPQALDIAVALADRAVDTTSRGSASLLDTLAEALFQNGDRIGALVTIDEAIELEPFESYYLEQRRRFSGERDAQSRPPPPEVWDGRPPGDEPFEDYPDEGLAPALTI